MELGIFAVESLGFAFSGVWCRILGVLNIFGSNDKP